MIRPRPTTFPGGIPRSPRSKKLLHVHVESTLRPFVPREPDGSSTMPVLDDDYDVVSRSMNGDQRMRLVHEEMADVFDVLREPDGSRVKFVLVCEDPVAAHHSDDPSVLPSTSADDPNVTELIIASEEPSAPSARVEDPGGAPPLPPPPSSAATSAPARIVRTQENWQDVFLAWLKGTDARVKALVRRELARLALALTAANPDEAAQAMADTWGITRYMEIRNMDFHAAETPPEAMLPETPPEKNAEEEDSSSARKLRTDETLNTNLTGNISGDNDAGVLAPSGDDARSDCDSEQGGRGGGELRALIRSLVEALKSIRANSTGLALGTLWAVLRVNGATALASEEGALDAVCRVVVDAENRRWRGPHLRVLHENAGETRERKGGGAKLEVKMCVCVQSYSRTCLDSVCGVIL